MVTTAAIATAGVVTVYVLYKALKPRSNIFDTMPKYRPNPSDEMPDADKMSKIKRCSQPNENLEIVYSKNGLASRPTMTITQMLDLAVEKGGNKKVFSYELNDGNGNFKWCSYTWNDYGKQVNIIAKTLIALGIEPFDVVNLLGFCSPRYIFIHMAATYCGGLPAGIYTTSQSGGIEYITNLCKSKAVFIDTKENLKKYYSILKNVPSLKYIVVFRDTKEDQDLSDVNTILKEKYNIENPTVKIINWAEFIAIGEAADKQSGIAETNRTLETRKRNQVPTQCCNIVYTSGTTGFSKAVMLSHDNLFFQCVTLVNSVTYEYGGGEKLFRGRQMRGVAYLPLSHVAGQVVNLYYSVYAMMDFEVNLETFFARYTWKKTLKNTILAAQPTFFFGVPRIWEKFYEAMNSGLANASPIKKAMFNWILSNGSEMWQNQQVGESGEIPKMWPFISKYLCDGLVKKKIGFGKCTQFSSAGGVLNKTVRNTFAALNMPLLDGYGMTECAGAICTTRLNNLIADSVGPPLEGCDFRIEHIDGRDPPGHGEICFRGRNCMMGYLGEPEKTKKVFDDNGWLHSGDIGYINSNNVYITGRIKELLVTSGGENIAPIPAENYIRKQCPALSQVVMCGDGRKYCSLLVTIASEIDDNYVPSSDLQPHAQLIDESCKSVEDAMKSKKWFEYIRNGIISYNNNKEICASNAARIQYFQILPKDLNIYDGTLSPTMKLKRKEIRKVYTSYIDKMYPTDGSSPTIAVVSRN